MSNLTTTVIQPQETGACHQGTGDHLPEGEDDDLLVLLDNLQVFQVPISIQ